MSTRVKLIKARLGMLALAEELQNISLACRRAGIVRRQRKWEREETGAKLQVVRFDSPSTGIRLPERANHSFVRIKRAQAV